MKILLKTIFMPLCLALLLVAYAAKFILFILGHTVAALTNVAGILLDIFWIKFAFILTIPVSIWLGVNMMRDGSVVGGIVLMLMLSGFALLVCNIESIGAEIGEVLLTIGDTLVDLAKTLITL